MSEETPALFKINGHDVRIHLTEPLTSDIFKACIAEFLALYFFVIVCCGCAMGTFANEVPNRMEVAACFGFAILAIAQFVGPLSGGHVNCAVTFALFLAGRISGLRAFLYFIFQMFGSFAGALTLLYIYGDHWEGAAGNFGSNAWDPELFNGGTVFIAEAIGTILLVWTVLSTVDIPSNSGGGSMGAFPIAMSIMVAHLFLLPIDGCSINPTRSFGPSVVAYMVGIDGHYRGQQHIMWLGPMFGAFLAAVLYEYGSLKPPSRDTGQSMQEAMYSSPEEMGGTAKPSKINPTARGGGGELEVAEVTHFDDEK